MTVRNWPIVIILLLTGKLFAGVPVCDGSIPADFSLADVYEEASQAQHHSSTTLLDEAQLQLDLRKKLLKGVKKGLTKNEIYSIWAYSIDLYGIMNGALRSDEDLLPFKNYLSLCSGLMKLPRYSGKVYRTVFLHRDQIDNFNINSIIEFKAFTSTASTLSGLRSYLSKSGDDFTVLMIIKTKSGRKISQYALDASEDEILIPAGSRFKVTTVENASFFTQVSILRPVNHKIYLEEI